MNVRSMTMLGASRFGGGLGVATCLLTFAALAAQPALAQAVTHVTTAPSEPEDDEMIPMCQTAVRLSGAVYNSTHPERSFAVFEPEKSHNGSVYRVGTWIDDMELVEVAPRGVVLRGPNGECWLQLIRDATAVRATAEKPRRTRSRPKGAKRPSKSEAVVIGSTSAR